MSLRRRLIVILIAAVAAALAWTVAPDSWDPGPGRLEIGVLGTPILDEPVGLGSTSPISLEERTRFVSIVADLPNGVPVDEPIEVAFAIEGASVAIGDVAVTLILTDGSRELVPVLTQQGNGFRAVRRPPVDVDVMLALLAVVVVLWVSEAVPIFVTALAVPVVATVSGIATAREALAPFADPIIVLFFSGFLMAEAMRRVDLDHWVAVHVVARAGKSPVRLFAVMIAFAAFMSMWMSNTAAVAVLLPIALAITGPLQHQGYRKAMVLGLAYAATIGGVGSAIGTPANLLAIEFLDTVTGVEITFVGWFPFGLPMVALFLPILGLYMWNVSSVRLEPARFAAVRERARADAADMPALTQRQLAVTLVFVAVVVGWLTQQWHGVSPGIVALAGAIVLFVVGLLETEDLQRISWPALLTFGGGLTLGSLMVATGTSDWVVSRLGGLASWPTMLAIAGVAAVTLALTTVASNTGSAATLIPLAIPLAGLIGVSPTLLVIVVAIASSIDFALVVGTPPTMLAYSSELFTTGEIFRKGAVLDVVGLVLLVAAVVPLWQVLGLV